MKYDIVIVGAGASGLVAAYRAITKNPQLNILVLEKEKQVGRKLSASGNGKCNLTNADFQTKYYHSNNEEFVATWIKQHTYTEITEFFVNLGILLYEKNGYYYPHSNQAKQVRNLLYEKSKRLGVEYQLPMRVTTIESHSTGYTLIAIDENQKECIYHSKSIIIATGGCASGKLGGCKDGYQLVKNLGLQCDAIYPVLSPIYVKDANLHLAKGVRIDGIISVKIGEDVVLKEAGQVQFNADNLSGIVMMNASCYLNRRKNEMHTAILHMDVLPQYTWGELKTFFEMRRKNAPSETIEMMLQGILPATFVSYIAKRLKLDTTVKLDKLTEKQINRITSALKKLEFTPTYVEDFEKAQVTGGGISVKEISVDTFESSRYKNLYIVGEVLDVNGKCGGYNLTFAMLSGIQAADAITGGKHD